jgi:hypothetical protein
MPAGDEGKPTPARVYGVGNQVSAIADRESQCIAWSPEKELGRAVVKDMLPI